MPCVNNVNFSESKFALLFQHTTENNFWRPKKHLVQAYPVITYVRSLDNRNPRNHHVTLK